MNLKVSSSKFLSSFTFCPLFSYAQIVRFESGSVNTLLQMTHLKLVNHASIRYTFATYSHNISFIMQKTKRVLCIAFRSWKQHGTCHSKSLSVYRKPHTTAQLPWTTDFNVTHRIHVYYCFVTCSFGDLISLEPPQLPAFSTGVTLNFGLKWHHTGWFLSVKQNIQHANIFLLENIFIFTVSQFSAVIFTFSKFHFSISRSENSL